MPRFLPMIVISLLCLDASTPCVWSQELQPSQSPVRYGVAYQNPYGKFPEPAKVGDRRMAEFFHRETQALSGRVLNAIESKSDWENQRASLRRELFEMLGLDPMPAKTDLQATITGTLDHPEFTVEKLHFQSRPGLYVTANLYLPKGLTQPAPTILYVCGHGPVKVDGVSYGNKASYQHHGAWFARNGYVCMLIDTVQLGEIEGIHHGTHREGMWWWNSRGYTSAGAEAWNCIRALDYLQSRSEVDPNRIGVTGRSGGGAYSWWIAALDERIQAACPVAGITDLQNHVVDGCVEGHCDCMYMVNTYRWDYSTVAALVAPRPLLICNSDKDRIFPLDGIVRLHSQTRRIYDLMNASDKIGLVITEGPHKDTQELQVPVMRWFNRWLKNDANPVANVAEKLFTPQQLKVFERLPADEITSRCYEDFTVLASDTRPFDPKRSEDLLRQKTFAAWPVSSDQENSESLAIREVSRQEANGVRLTVVEFNSQPSMPLRLYVAQPADGPAASLNLEIVDQKSWQGQLKLGQVGFAMALEEELAAQPTGSASPITADQIARFEKWMREILDRKTAYATLTPRGVGRTQFGDETKYQTHLRRRFMLLGTTLASMQAWDMLQATRVVRELPGCENLPLQLHASSDMTEVASFAAIFADDIDSISLKHPPRADREAPDFLNWSRIVTPKQLLGLLETKTKVRLPKGSR